MKLARISRFMVFIFTFVIIAYCIKPEIARSNPVDRDCNPLVLEPKTDGEKQMGNDLIALDYSQMSQGYINVRYQGTADKVKLFTITPKGKKYQYDIQSSDGWVVVPLTGGDGSYALEVYEHIKGTTYSTLFKESLVLELDNEFGPFLYPNQFCWFTKDSDVVSKGAEIAKGSKDDIDVVTRIYDYVIENIAYDSEMADQIVTGKIKTYIPDVDQVLHNKKGICFDYAAVMCAMLRSQRIPTKLQIGYSGEAYHAWISVWTEETGWVDNVIQFDGKKWALMDPTLAANNSAKSVKKYVGDGSNYLVEYSR